MAGSRVGGQLNELKDLAANFFGGGKLILAWPEGDVPAELPEDLGKLLLNMLLLGAETLPFGGTMTVGITAADGHLSLGIVATGERAAMREETRPAMAKGAATEDLTPRNVQAYFTCRITERMGGELTCDETAEGRVGFNARMPHA